MRTVGKPRTANLVDSDSGGLGGGGGASPTVRLVCCFNMVQCLSLFYSYMLGVGLARRDLVLVMVLQVFGDISVAINNLTHALDPPFSSSY